MLIQVFQILASTPQSSTTRTNSSDDGMCDSAGSKVGWVVARQWAMVAECLANDAVRDGQWPAGILGAHNKHCLAPTQWGQHIQSLHHNGSCML